MMKKERSFEPKKKGLCDILYLQLHSSDRSPTVYIARDSKERWLGLYSKQTPPRLDNENNLQEETSGLDNI